MLLYKQMPLLKFTERFLGNINNFRHLHVSSSSLRSVGSWRLSQGLPAKGREYGPSVDLPDWSYADGRPAPLAEGQKKRIRLQKQYYDNIMHLSKEVDKCLDLNRQKAKSDEEARQKVIRNRLKTKENILK